jgi:gluconokinase
MLFTSHRLSLVTRRALLYDEGVPDNEAKGEESKRDGELPEAGAIEAREARAPFVLALDAGTSSVRAAVYDARGTEIRDTSARINRGFHTTTDGGAELDAEEAIADAVSVIDDALARSPSEIASRIEAVAVACFWHSLVGVNSDGRALTPVLGWADTRPAAQAEALRRALDERAARRRTGCRFHASYWPAKILWLRRERAEASRGVSRWMSFGELLLLRLCGESKTSVSLASGTGLFDQHSCDWDAPLFEELNLDTGRVPEIAADGETFTLNSEYAGRWPQLRGRRVFPAIGDGAANNVGEGSATRARAALMIGTSAAMRVVYESDPPGALAESLWCYRVDRRRVVVGGALSDGGGLREWLSETLALRADVETDELANNELENAAHGDAIEKDVAGLRPDAHGLTVLPFWAGERSTGWHAEARGAILGLTSHTRPVEILRAAMEAVAYRLALVASSLEAHAPGATLTASGGALRSSRAWTQIVADVLGRPLNVSRVGEASSRGAVLLALEAMGEIKSVAEMSAPPGELFEPDAARHEIYRRGLERQQKFYELLIDNQEKEETKNT